MNQEFQTIFDSLTKTQKEYCGLILDGLDNNQIADKICVSVGSVKWMCGIIYKRFSVDTRFKLIALSKEYRVAAIEAKRQEQEALDKKASESKKDKFLPTGVMNKCF